MGPRLVGVAPGFTRAVESAGRIDRAGPPDRPPDRVARPVRSYA
ncbi:hypothetical protein OOK13_08815 [Streptomyces sp. NBC_00378]|nr:MULTISPECIES: hypothetical protein [unclassified Streptomyces]MCX5108629.1 hypothetical protein [Streptomyces sp. NBC_00378]